MDRNIDPPNPKAWTNSYSPCNCPFLWRERIASYFYTTIIALNFHNFTISNLENTRLLLLLSILQLSDYPFLFCWFSFPSDFCVVTCSASPLDQLHEYCNVWAHLISPTRQNKCAKRSHHCWQNMLIYAYFRKIEKYTPDVKRHFAEWMRPILLECRSQPE